MKESRLTQHSERNQVDSTQWMNAGWLNTTKESRLTQHSERKQVDSTKGRYETWTLDWTVDWTMDWLHFGLDSVPVLPFKEDYKCWIAQWAGNWHNSRYTHYPLPQPLLSQATPFAKDVVCETILSHYLYLPMCCSDLKCWHIRICWIHRNL